MKESASGEITAVFIQSPADVRYALAVCELAAQRGAAILLIVVNVRSLYEFLAGIQLAGVEVHFVPYVLQPMPRSPWTLFRIWRQLCSHYTSVFGRRSVAEAWFFCVESDAVTPFFLKRLSKRSQIFLVDHYSMNEARERRWPVRLAVKWLFLRMVTGVSFGFCREVREAGVKPVWRTNLDPAQCNANTIDLAPSLARFPLPPNIHPQVAILMDSNEEASLDMHGYANAVATLLGSLSARNFNVLLKGHPRSGYSPFLTQFELTTIPAGCPLELFNIESVAAVIGVVSLGLAAVAREGYMAVSLLYVIGFHNEGSRQFWREWMDRHSNGKILFPRSVPEAVTMIEGSLVMPIKSVCVTSLSVSKEKEQNVPA